jgi:hypothetical protein
MRSRSKISFKTTGCDTVGTIVATAALAEAPPDGSTLLLARTNDVLPKPDNLKGTDIKRRPTVS